MSGARVLRFAITAGLLVSPLVHAAADAERREIAQARQRLEADYAERERACRQQFVVTSCIDAAQATRREGITALRAREAELDDRERRQRAAARQSRIDEKQRRAGETAAPLPPLVAAPEGRRPLLPSRPASEPSTPVPKKSTMPKPDEAAEAARFDARQREVREKKEQAAKREAERQRSGKAPAAALPPIQAASKAR